MKLDPPQEKNTKRRKKAERERESVLQGGGDARRERRAFFINKKRSIRARDRSLQREATPGFDLLVACNTNSLSSLFFSLWRLARRQEEKREVLS